MNLEELRALTPEERDAILASQAESLTPVERLMVHLNIENQFDESRAFALVDDLMIAYVWTAEPLTPGAADLRDMLVEVAERWLPPSDVLKFVTDQRDAEIRETDALKSRLVESNNRVKDNEIQIIRMGETIRRYKTALEKIHSKLSTTNVPSQKWVKTLHGELFAIAHYEMEQP